jgi:N-acetylgalactosamine-6-sulfatase
VTRRHFLQVASGAFGAAADSRPNFVFILCDDLGWGDLPCYGHQRIVAHGGWNVRGDLKTPAIGRLAAEGTRFTQFYVASAVCSPSRAAFLTGQFPARLGIHDYLASPDLNRKRGVADYLDPAVPTLARLLKSAGYATGHFGKWHLGVPGGPQPEQYGIDRYHNGLDLGRPRSSESIASHALQFIEEHRGPFYVNLWLYDPHSPLHPTGEMMEPYSQFGSGWKSQRSAFEIYYAVLSFMDAQIGRILGRLDDLGIANNTVVVFSSDNGPESALIPFVSFYGAASSAGPFRGVKRSLYEGGVRTPFIVRWPGRTPAGKVDNGSVIGGVDLLPAFCRLAGVPASAVTDGEDVSAALAGREHKRRRALFWENRFPVYGHVLDMSPMLAIRQGKWKLLMNPDRSRIELYDIPADPSEVTNRAAAQPAIVRDLSERLLAWQAGLPKGPVHPDAGTNRYPWPEGK